MDGAGVEGGHAKRAAQRAAPSIFSRYAENAYAAAATDTTEAMRLKMVEMLSEMPGNKAPAATEMVCEQRG
jgi:hypothetical protein